MHRIILVLMALPIACYAQDEKLLTDYFSFLAKETTYIEKQDRITDVGSLIIYKVTNSQGETYYTITSDIEKYGCFSVVISYNKRGMSFLDWEGRWFCDSVEEKLKHYKSLNEKDFRPVDLM